MHSKFPHITLKKYVVFICWEKKKGFSDYMQYMKMRFLSRPLLMHDLRGNYILSLNKLEKRVMVLVLFSYVSAKLRNALPDFIRTHELLVLKRESRAAFCTAAFFVNEDIFKYYVFSRLLYMLCILAVNVMSRRY